MVLFMACSLDFWEKTVGRRRKARTGEREGDPATERAKLRR